MMNEGLLDNAKEHPSRSMTGMELPMEEGVKVREHEVT